MIKSILAVDYYGGMGFNGSLPWPHNPEDLRHFQQLTHNHVVVMGRKTWDDPKMPKPLNNRTVYVATSRPTMHASVINGDIRQHVLDLERRHSDKIIWVIGGPEIILSCQDIFDAIHVSHIKGSYRSDTKIDLKVLLRGFAIKQATGLPDNPATFVRYEPLFSRSTL